MGDGSGVALADGVGLGIAIGSAAGVGEAAGVGARGRDSLGAGVAEATGIAIPPRVAVERDRQRRSRGPAAPWPPASPDGRAGSDAATGSVTGTTQDRPAGSAGSPGAGGQADERLLAVGERGCLAHRDAAVGRRSPRRRGGRAPVGAGQAEIRAGRLAERSPSSRSGPAGASRLRRVGLGRVGRGGVGLGGRGTCRLGDVAADVGPARAVAAPGSSETASAGSRHGPRGPGPPLDSLTGCESLLPRRTCRR